MGMTPWTGAIGATGIRIVRSEGRPGSFPGRGRRLRVGLVAALRHDERAHLLGHVDVRVAHVAVGVGQRVVGLVDDPALGVAELRCRRRRRRCPRRLRRPRRSVAWNAAPLVRVALLMLAMLSETASSHLRWTVRAEPAMPIASKVISWSSSRCALQLNSPPMARAANWKRSTVSMLERVSVSRLTLLPFSRVGSSERAGGGADAAVAGPHGVREGGLEATRLAW